MKTIIIILLAAIIFLVVAKIGVDYTKTGTLPFITKTAKVTINNATFTTEVANTAKKKELGLSSRQDLPENSAMLFPFEKPDYYPFWMRNMKFPLDIIYIKEGKIVALFENSQPSSNNESPQIYTPSEPADAVLEISAGLSKKYNIKTGDSVTVK